MKKIPSIETISNTLVGITISLYLLRFLPAEYILSDTIATGGDTCSHYKTADYLVNYLLPQGKVIGWFPGNYGGFPVFIYYFPPLYLLSAALSVFMPLTISFKLITLLGPLLLPICSYWMIRLMGWRFPAPSFAAVGSLLFLFNSSNSMWGGNFYSTLAGEFSYAAGFSLTFLFFGLLGDLIWKIKKQSKGEQRNEFLIRETILTSLVFCLVGLCHGFTMLICIFASLFFLFSHKNFLSKAAYIALILWLGGLLFSWWFIPLFLNLPFTTQFQFIWIFTSLEEKLPQMLRPGLLLFVLLTIYALIPSKFRFQILSEQEKDALKFAWFVIFISIIAFFNSDKLRLPDIRFIPFIQYMVNALGFAALGSVFLRYFLNKYNFCKIVLPLLILAPTIWLIERDFGNNRNKWDVKAWIKWNYSGFEKAQDWETFKAVNQFLKGDFNDPRVVFEHNELINNMGSIRAFESLPFFSGRATLEGLYFQSSLLSPFVFYMQSLYSKQISCPFPEYPCSHLDLKRAYDYLKLTNVNQLIFSSEDTKKQAANLTNLYAFEQKFFEGQYEVWKVKGETSYVEVLDKAPQYIPPDHFRYDFYKWFRAYKKGSRFLYTLPKSFSYFYGTDKIPLSYYNEEKNPGLATDCKIEDRIDNEGISFTTTCPGQPHLLKFAYNPGWKVEGAVGPYLISPAFMLLYPTSKKVVLKYENYGPKTLGKTLFVIGLLTLLLLFLANRQEKIRSFLNYLHLMTRDKKFNKLLYILFILLLVVSCIKCLTVIFKPSYQARFNKAEVLYTNKKYGAAQQEFKKISEEFYFEPTIAKVYYYLAISYQLDNKHQEALDSYLKLAELEDSQYHVEAIYNIGLCLSSLGRKKEAKEKFVYLRDRLAESPWADYAADRLREFGG